MDPKKDGVETVYGKKTKFGGGNACLGKISIDILRKCCRTLLDLEYDAHKDGVENSKLKIVN